MDWKFRVCIMLDAGARSAMVLAHVLAQFARVMAFGAVILMSNFCKLSRKHFSLDSFGTKVFF